MNASPFSANMVSRNGIYYDLNKSVYKFTIDDTNMTFVFSSDLHLTKFEEQYREHRKEHSIKLKARYRLNIKSTIFADLLLYIKVETRGFLVINERGQKLHQETLIICGEKATTKD